MVILIHYVYTIPIIDDEDAWLSVCGRKRNMEGGRPFAFHDNDKHWAQHNGTRDRIVVIMDYSLSQLEKRWHIYREMGGRTCYIIYKLQFNHD